MKYNDIKKKIKGVIAYQEHKDNIDNDVDALASDLIANKFTDAAYDAIIDNINDDDVISIEVNQRYSYIHHNNLTVIDMGEVEELIETNLTPEQLKAIIKKLNDDNEINNDMYADPDSISGGTFSVYMQPGAIHIDLMCGAVVASKLSKEPKSTLSLSAFKKLLK